MTPERWKEIEALYQSALDSPPEERANLLANANPALREAVERMLAQESGGGLLDVPAAAHIPAGSMVDFEPTEQMPPAGSMLGPYRIDSVLGVGGMGAVYRAHDTRLGRFVAVKVSRERFSARFEREARHVAALNHPHICTVHDVGPNYLVMELYEGETLAALMQRGQLDVAATLRIGSQIADALADAHSKGIIHRDLKPGNIMMTRSGAKVLDFGLATASNQDDRVTAVNVVVGTPAYMSPEQRAGKNCDSRTDIYSLGLILFEMATGARAQAGAFPAKQPKPRELARIIERCLQGEPDQRWQSAAALKQALDELRTKTESPGPVLSRLLPAAALMVLVALAGWWFLVRSPVMAGTDSIAVLPFVNSSGNPEMEYLSDGITESLINSLSQVPKLTVMSRNAVFRYKGPRIDAQTAGTALKVKTVVTGRVIQRGGDLSISTELTEVETNRQLWGEQYNKRIGDILSVQEEISTEISEKLRFKLTGEERKRVVRRYTQNTEAYQSYLKGRYHWNKKTEAGFNKGIEYFQKAIDTDPNYAPAYAGLATCYTNLANYNFALIPPKEAWARAKAAAEKAIEIDGNLASGHAALALVEYQWSWDWAKADAEFRRALQLDPGSTSSYEPSPSSTHHWHAHYLMTVGKPEESFRAARRGLDLDPMDLANNSHQGWHFLFTRQYDRAIPPLQKTIEMDANFLPGQWYLGLAYEQRGDYKNAIAQFQNCVRLTNGRPSMLALLGHAYAVAKRPADADAVLQQLSAASKKRYVPSYPVAAIYAGLDRKDEAIAWLEKAFDEHDSWMDYLGLDPRLDGLRSDPRFAALMRRMNLASATNN